MGRNVEEDNTIKWLVRYLDFQPFFFFEGGGLQVYLIQHISTVNQNKVNKYYNNLN